jgi:hypothetical protein
MTLAIDDAAGVKLGNARNGRGALSSVKVDDLLSGGLES